MVFSPHHGEVASAALEFQVIVAATDAPSLWGTGGLYKTSTESAVPVLSQRSLCNFLQQGSWLPEQVIKHSLLPLVVWHASNVA